MSNHILVLGANSEICHHLCRIWAAAGDQLLLVSRNEEQMERIANDLKARGASKVTYEGCDLSLPDQERFNDWVNEGLGGRLDRIIVAYGEMRDHEVYCHDPTSLGAMLQTNLVSSVVWMRMAANFCAEQGHGLLVALGSVAGDRARKGNYLYGLSKAGLAYFCDGLRMELQNKGVDVLLVKPGMTTTKMTQGMVREGLLWSSPQKVAGLIAKAVDQRRDVVYVPGFWRLIMWVIKMIPKIIFRRMNI